MAALAVLASVLVVTTGGRPAEAVAPLGAVTVAARGINSPLGIATGPDGNEWFTNNQNSSIGRVTPAGTVTNFAGAGIDFPRGITAGPDGNLWFTNDTNSIGRITPTGVVTAFTGAGIDGPHAITTGPDGNLWFTNAGAVDSIGRITPTGAVTTFTDATVNCPYAIVTGPDGNLWFTNFDNGRIGRITPTGVISSFTAPDIIEPNDITTGPDGNLWFTNLGGDTIGRITPAGVVTTFADPAIHEPHDIAAGTDGNLWFTNARGATKGSIGRITPAGVFTFFTDPTISHPDAITTGPNGDLWFLNGGSIGRVTPAGVVSNIDDPRLNQPFGIASGPDGNLWFTNEFPGSISRMTPGGVFTNFTDPGMQHPRAITAGPDGNLWFTDVGTVPAIGRITPTGSVTIFTDPGVSEPLAIAAGPDGNLWFTNAGNNTIGRISPAGVISSFAGPGVSGPSGITAGPDGNLWFTNARNNTIGRITPAGVISDVAGSGINAPQGITAGADGNLWFVSFLGSSIGRITPAGTVTAFTDPGIDLPVGITTGVDGNVWFANSLGGSIGRIDPSGVVTTYAGPSWLDPTAVTSGADGNIWFTSPHNAVGFVGTHPEAPAPPTAATAAAGTASATVSWAAPTVNGGSPVTGYTVTSNPGARTCSWSSGPLSCRVIGLTPGVAYSFAVTATNATGTSAASDPSNIITPWAGSVFHPVVPTRILDSRTATGGWGAKLTATTPRNLQVVGAGGVPDTASAVVVNVTATGSTAGSFLTVWPAGPPVPATSNLNFAAGQTIANLVTAPIGAGGQVSFATAVGAVDVVADVVGYYDDSAAPGDLFNGITPTRVLDSRGPTGGWSGRLGAGTPRDLTVRAPGNPAGVPPTATAVIANITATNGSAGSFLSVWPSGVTQPDESNLNFAAGQTIPNLAIVQIGANGKIRFANAVGAVDVIVDVVGYFDPTAGSRFHPITPTRILDDRTGTGLTGPWGPGQSRALPVAGATGTAVPAGATGLVANVTATNGTTGSFVTVYPDGVPEPASSSLNFGPGQTIPNLVTVALPANGRIDLSNELGHVDLVTDAVGYYAST